MICVLYKDTKDGNQHTEIIDVEDGSTLHKNLVENTKLLTFLNKIYGDGVTFTRRIFFDYLRMNMNCSKKEVLGVSMFPYIYGILEQFQELIDNTSLTPAVRTFFKVREKGKLLDEDQTMIFHHTVAYLIFLCMRVRRYIQITVGFLMTRVTEPDKDDWGKVKRILQYLKGTRSLKLCLSRNNMHCTK